MISVTSHVSLLAGSEGGSVSKGSSAGPATGNSILKVVPESMTLVA